MEQRDYQPEMLLEALKSRSVPKVRRIFEYYNLVDIAETLNTLDNIREYVFIFKTIPPEYTSDVFTYLDAEVQETIINELTGEQISDILENVNSDDIVDFLQEMPANLITKILQAAPKDRRAQINQLLDYKEDCAGSIMTTEFIALKEMDTMQSALVKVKKFGRKAETISYLFVINEKRILKGTLKLKDILFMEDDQVIGDIMESDFVSVYANTDQEEVAMTFKKYDLNAIPVTTADDRLVGIITADDIIDVIEEEATEDIHMMANVNPLEEEYMKTTAWELTKKGAGWLALLMLLGTFTSFIMNGYEDAMIAVPCLSIFVPMLIDTAGNAGNQSSVLIIRGLALGEISTADYLKVVFKEFRVSLMVGFAVSVVNFLWVLFTGSVGIIDLSASSLSPATLGLLVASAMFVSIVLSKFIGSSLPLVIKKIKIDPAMLAGPMVTTLVDATSLIIYFVLATRIFRLL